MRRHDLVYLRPEAWRSLLATRGDLAAESIVAGWVDNGWPLIGRRSMPDEDRGVALGLPLPPFAGKRRLAFLVQPEDIVSTAPPPALCSVRQFAPEAWWPTLDRLVQLASQHAVETAVFGSLAWNALTRLDYLTNRSDLDLLLHIRRDTDLHSLVACIAEIESTAPMRLDGELVRGDGAAVNWREVHAGKREFLVKSMRGVAVLDAAHFCLGSAPT